MLSMIFSAAVLLKRRAPAADSLQKMRRSFPKTCSEATVEMAASVSIVFTAFPRTSSSSQLVPCTAPVCMEAGSKNDPVYYLKDGALSIEDVKQGHGGDGRQRQHRLYCIPSHLPQLPAHPMRRICVLWHTVDSFPSLTTLKRKAHNAAEVPQYFLSMSTSRQLTLSD